MAYIAFTKHSPCSSVTVCGSNTKSSSAAGGLSVRPERRSRATTRAAQDQPAAPNLPPHCRITLAVTFLASLAIILGVACVAVAADHHLTLLCRFVAFGETAVAFPS
jgi:hypothetical protein